MKTIGRYEIIGALGRGGMSKVYLVRLPRIGKIAALKVFAPSDRLVAAVGQDALRERFVFEAAAMAGMRHPHVLEVWRLDETESGLCYLMEYFCQNLGVLMGETYWAEAPTRVLPVDRAVRYTRQTLAGLSRLHFEGMVHRDIKPFNLMITDQDEVKLADFGLSVRRGEASPFPKAFFVGTRGYAAPEQASDPESADARADLFAAGVVLYRMLTGTLPETPSQPVSRGHANLDSAWDAFFEQALALEPDNRFHTAREMSTALGRLHDDFMEKQEATCRVSEPPPARPSIPAHRVRLRSEPVAVSAQRAGRRFSLDALNRPARPVENDFAAGGDDTIMDRATGLCWQQGGSAYPMTMPEARAHVQTLNQDRFAGRSDWRLPTVDELLSLIRPETADEYCLEPIFDTRQQRLWSADRRSRRAAWYVDARLGFVASHDENGYFHVKAVAGPMES